MRLPYSSLSQAYLPAGEDGISQALGNQQPLIGGTGRRAPDKRRVSIRWMTGSVLTGLTSVILMGAALYAALDGRQQMTQPASVLEGQLARSGAEGKTLKGDRPVAIIALEPVNQRVLQVPTMSRAGEATVIRKRPFAYASAPLAAVPRKKISYPKFDALSVFRASRSDNAVASNDSIYTADIESEVLIKQVPLAIEAAIYDRSTQISVQEAEQIVREAMPSLEDGGIQIAALPYLDPARFELDEDSIAPPSTLGIRITAENVSRIVLLEDAAQFDRGFEEEVVVVPPQQSLDAALAGLELDQGLLENMTSALSGELGTGPLSSGTRLRVVWERRSDGNKKVARRIGVYRGGTHIRSVALNDRGRVVRANEPAEIEATRDDDSKRESQIQTVARTNLPNVYEGIYRATLSQGLSKDHAKRIVRTAAFDVDFRNRISPKDELEVFYSLEEGEEEATSESEILYVGLTLSGAKRSYYRFRAADDASVDYYDETGKSAKKFLLRKPVPNGRFHSPFGMRRHPISRTYKMHNGVDFSAPRGTPIIAAGDGVVEKAGWRGGNGRHTVIRHANGYKTSYSHQYRIAPGIRPGARVVQGQIIGQVGSTGYSTGPHLHYEVSVNSRKVNPMKIRLPQGRVLKGSVLAAFKRERDRIDVLLNKGRGVDTQTVASLN